MMSEADTGWERQRAFLAVLQTGSLSGAARALGLAQPTVRRRIEDLESAVGTALFTRSPGGLTPTDTALALAEHANAMALAADAFVRTASAAAGEIAGTVRVTASEIVAIEVLPPILAPVLAAHPGLVVALSATNRSEDVLRRESDIAIRMVRPTQEGLVARRVGHVTLGLFAHADYIARAGMPSSITDRSGQRLIGAEHDSESLRSVQVKGLTISPQDFGFRTDSDCAQLAAVRAGIGIGAVQLPIAARQPELVRVLADQFAFELDFWVTAHEDLRGVARVRTVFDAVVDGLVAYLTHPSAAASIAVAAPRSV